MGPKFVIVFSGIDLDGVVNFIDDLKEQVEAEVIKHQVKKKDGKNRNINIKPKLNFAVTTYYKGTALENVTKKLEEYLDSANPEESDINNI